MASERIQRRIDRLLDQIEEAADLREWGQVILLAEDLLAFAPDNADARTFLDAAQRRLSGQQGSIDKVRILAASPSATPWGQKRPRPRLMRPGESWPPLESKH